MESVKIAWCCTAGLLPRPSTVRRQLELAQLARRSMSPKSCDFREDTIAQKEPRAHQQRVPTIRRLFRAFHTERSIHCFAIQRSILYMADVPWGVAKHLLHGLQTFKKGTVVEVMQGGTQYSSEGDALSRYGSGFMEDIFVRWQKSQWFKFLQAEQADRQKAAARRWVTMYTTSGRIGNGSKVDRRIGSGREMKSCSSFSTSMDSLDNTFSRLSHHRPVPRSRRRYRSFASTFQPKPTRIRRFQPRPLTSRRESETKWWM